MNSVVSLENAHKVYHTGDVDVHAVQGVSLGIGSGEFVAVMGASGSGKSTLMNILGCLDRLTSGRFMLGDDDVSRCDSDALADIRNRRIGFVFQNFNLLSRTSALENVELPLLYARQRLTMREQRERALRTLAVVGLTGREDHHPNQLSGGQQQRVALARALINEPAMLLADEPTGNLDSLTSVEIMSVFQTLNRRGMTVVMVTHEPDIAAYAKRKLVMRDGHLISDTAIPNPTDAERELARLRAEHPTTQEAK